MPSPPEPNRLADLLCYARVERPVARGPATVWPVELDPSVGELCGGCVLGLAAALREGRATAETTRRRLRLHNAAERPLLALFGEAVPSAGTRPRLAASVLVPAGETAEVPVLPRMGGTTGAGARGAAASGWARRLEALGAAPPPAPPGAEEGAPPPGRGDARPVGFVVGAGERVLGAEIVADARLFAAVAEARLAPWLALAREAEGAGESPARGVRPGAQAFLEALAHGRQERFAAAGAGAEVELRSRSGAGLALERERLLHLVATAREPGRRERRAPGAGPGRRAREGRPRGARPPALAFAVGLAVWAGAAALLLWRCL